MSEKNDLKIKQLTIPEYGGKWRGRVMEEVTDEITSESISLRFSKKHGAFYFEDAGLYYTCATIAPLKPKARELLSQRQGLDFIPVIRVTLSKDGHRDPERGHNKATSGITLQFERLYLGHHSGARVVREINWDIYDQQRGPRGGEELSEEEQQAWQEKHRASMSEILWYDIDALPELPYKHEGAWYEKNNLYVAYSEELFQRLLDLHGKLWQLHDALDALITKDHVHELLTTNLLPAPTTTLLIHTTPNEEDDNDVEE